MYVFKATGHAQHTQYQTSLQNKNEEMLNLDMSRDVSNSPSISPSVPVITWYHLHLTFSLHRSSHKEIICMFVVGSKHIPSRRAHVSSFGPPVAVETWSVETIYISPTPFSPRLCFFGWLYPDEEHLCVGSFSLFRSRWTSCLWRGFPHCNNQLFV